MNHDYEIVFDGTPAHGRYLDTGLHNYDQRIKARPATAPPAREDDRGRPADPIDILGVLKQVNLPINKTELMQRTGKSRERVWVELQKLIETGQVVRTMSNNYVAVYEIRKR